MDVSIGAFAIGTLPPIPIIVIYFHKLFDANIILFIFLFIIATPLLSVPGNLILQVLSSTFIKVVWTPPPNAERLPLIYHIGYSSEFTGRMSTPTTQLSLVLTGLHPFDEYTVTVEAENNGGRGRPVVKKATTLSAGMCSGLSSTTYYEWIYSKYQFVVLLKLVQKVCKLADN